MEIFYELEIDPSHVIGNFLILNAFIFVFFYAQFTSFKLFSVMHIAEHGANS